MIATTGDAAALGEWTVERQTRAGCKAAWRGTGLATKWHSGTRTGSTRWSRFLEPEEERDLELHTEGSEARAHGMEFRSVPIADRAVPPSRMAFVGQVEAIGEELASGRNVVLHCRQGVGRTGVMAACLMLMRGEKLDGVLETLSRARGLRVPETAEQLRWLEHFADSLNAVR